MVARFRAGTSETGRPNTGDRQAIGRTLDWSRINADPTSFEGLPSPPPSSLPTETSRPRWSRLSLIAGVLAVPSLVLVLLLPGWLFQRMVAFEMEDLGPVFLTLVIAIWTGFVGAIFGGLAVRRLQGTDPGKRGRGWAVLATAGSRGLLMVVGGALGSVVLGRGGVEGGDPEFLLPRWIAGFAATLLLAGAYVRSRIRGARKPRKGRGWWAFGGGLLLHLLLIAALPFSLFQAFVTFRPEVVRGGGQNRRYEGPKQPGLYAQRELRLERSDSGKTTVIVRLWENGKARELSRRDVTGAADLEWLLIVPPGDSGALTLRWSRPETTTPEEWPLALPAGADVAPVLEPRILRIEPGSRTRLWLFQDFERTTPWPEDATPDRAIEVQLEAAPVP